MEYNDLSVETQSIIRNFGEWAKNDIEFIVVHQPNEKGFLNQLDYWLCSIIVSAEELREKIRIGD